MLGHERCPPSRVYGFSTVFWGCPAGVLARVLKGYSSGTHPSEGTPAYSKGTEGCSSGAQGILLDSVVGVLTGYSNGTQSVLEEDRGVQRALGRSTEGYVSATEGPHTHARTYQFRVPP